MTKLILIVDDEPHIREVAAVSLEAIGGFKVIAAPDGAEGYRRARDERPDAILLDVMMPVMDGPTTFRQLQEDLKTRDIPVIMLTAKAQAAELRSLHKLGVAAVLSKPFDPLRLPEHLSRALGWS